jgi:(1->4)-alpha-D-glucan 1-alpha-D-glucosylmutase
MDKFICIHGHFYQPPRENPWLEAIELQDSADPFHDWNQRVTAECYAPNTRARILDGEGRITRLANNYARISFDFGPTLLSWLEAAEPEVYRLIVEADRESRRRCAGHGSALAQAYNHMILPLANRRDKRTQVIWGVRDFEHRFGRSPEGMWLPETAVDLETLEVLAEQGIQFTILSPYQAGRIRAFGAESWRDVTGGRIDPTTAYLEHLPSGRTISLFFYDGPIANAVAFEGLLYQGENLAHRLVGAFSPDRPWPQLVHIATDGESYGHHHRHGDMGLAYALHAIERDRHARLTNYGEYLDLHPPTHEVEIVENTAWSCAHGVERWRSDCGCKAGRAGWSQAWRGPLREALDWLRDAAAEVFEARAAAIFQDPWQARDEYIAVVLDRAPETIARFLDRHAARALPEADAVAALKLLELQRHAMLMYTSCGWFFDELSGIETVQVIQYAGRAIQLAEELCGAGLEPGFVDRLGRARSNLPEHGDGRRIFEKFVQPAMIDWERIGAHYGVSSLFDSPSAQARVFCFDAEREDLQSFEVGKARLIVGRARLTSVITRESRGLNFGVLHLGDHNVNGGVHEFQGEAAYDALTRELSATFQKGDFAEIIRLMDREFGESTYSLRSLFRDEQRAVIDRLLRHNLAEVEGVYRRLHEQHMPTMRFLADLGIPLPRVFQSVAQFVVNTDLRWVFEEDDPDPEQVRRLMDEARTWRVDLDTTGLAFRLAGTIRRAAERLRDQPARLAGLQALDSVVSLARALPFEVDLWQAQNIYFELMETTRPRFQARAILGEPAAQAWLDQFVVLGDKMGVQVAEIKKMVVEVSTLEAIVQELLAQRRVPRATYRLQFHPGFTFRDAQAIVAYLAELGISDCYASPILEARAGSLHGYDIVDHGRLNPELGDQADFDAFTAARRAAGIGLLLDTVPNHMGINDARNSWWMDVLENGPSSVFADHFDIDWDPANPHIENKVLLPILEDQYGTVLEAGKVRLGYVDGTFALHYHETTLPLAPRTYGVILGHTLDDLVRSLGEEHESVNEYRSILTAIGHLPPRTERAPDRIAERAREQEVVKRRLDALYHSSPEVKRAIDAALRAFHGTLADPRSFDSLDALIGDQAYRPAYWRVAGEEINYRRFFDINELAAIRVERPEVFRATHHLFLRLLAGGKADGLRIDHPDGLWNPAEYFRQLQEQFVLEHVRARLPRDSLPDQLEAEVRAHFTARLGATEPPAPAWPLYVVAEKILSRDESLPADWAVFGTTGYDFLNAVNSLFVAAAGREAFDLIYHQFLGRDASFGDQARSCKKMIMLISMASEINALAHQLDRIAERNRRYRDFTLNSLTFALREVIACLPVYRTYISGPDRVAGRDRTFIEAAVREAKRQNPRTAESIFDFIRNTLLLVNLGDIRAEDRPAVVDWVMKFQQVTGPVMAKGTEDTAFYTYNRLVSLNEVGGHPGRFGISVADFHRQNRERLERWPHSMLATSTHDAKRGEDVRARLNVLSEVPDEWQAALARWRRLNAAKKVDVGGMLVPDPNTEYLLYQTLVGAWPAGPLAPEDLASFRERIAAYMHKATKEAKVHTSWVNPNADYDAAIGDFVARVIPDRGDDPFLADLGGFQERIAVFGEFNALAQALLKLTCPGVPDFYQGTELWDLNLVDPDNRRPVDYHRRRALLAELSDRIERAGDDLTPLTDELLAKSGDGRIKLYLIHRSLRFRRDHEPLLTHGSYVPLEAAGAQAEHVCAFERSHNDQAILVVVPRLVVGLTGGVAHPPLGVPVWDDTRLILPAGPMGRAFRNVFTGEVLQPGGQQGDLTIPLASILKQFPVALLERVGGEAS